MQIYFTKGINNIWLSVSNLMLLSDFRDMIATGCEDKCVRVFYVAASTDLPLKIFSGMHIF